MLSHWSLNKLSSVKFCRSCSFPERKDTPRISEFHVSLNVWCLLTKSLTTFWMPHPHSCMSHKLRTQTQTLSTRVDRGIRFVHLGFIQILPSAELVVSKIPALKLKQWQPTCRTPQKIQRTWRETSCQNWNQLLTNVYLAVWVAPSGTSKNCCSFRCPISAEFFTSPPICWRALKTSKTAPGFMIRLRYTQARPPRQNIQQGTVQKEA